MLHHETAPIQDDPYGQWEIATACDVSLGQMFKDNPILPSTSVIEMDEQAVAESLHRLDPSASGSILIKAMHYDSLKQQEEGRLGSARFSRKKGKGVVEIGIAGGVFGYSDSNALASVVSAYIGEVLYGTPRSTHNQEPFSEIYDKTSDKMDSIGRWRADEVQNTAIHELTHVVDELSPARRKQSALYSAKLALKDAVGTASIYMTALMSGNYVIHSIGVDSNPLYFGNSALSLILGIKTYKKVIKQRSENKRYLNNPDEIHARQVAANADEYPTIIKIVTNTN